MVRANKDKRLKVLLVNGSPHRSGNTFTALSEVARTLEEEGMEAEIVHVGNRPVQGCIGCYKCREKCVCVFQDETYLTLREKLAEADGIIIGSPVYFGGPSGSLCALLDRLFYSSGRLAQYKPAASVVVCRRGGATATFDRLNKYFTILNMPVVPSQYFGTACTGGIRAKPCGMRKACKPCARWLATWLGCCATCATVLTLRNRRRLHTNFIR